MKPVRLGRRETVCVTFADEGASGLTVYVSCMKGNPVAVIDRHGTAMLRTPTKIQKVVIRAWEEWLETDAVAFDGIGVPRLLTALRGSLKP